MVKPRGQFSRTLAGAMAAAALWTGGCVSEEVGGTPIDEITFTVVRAGRHVQFSWPSVTGQQYTVLFSKDRRPDHPWKPLPAVLNVLGTGETITAEDQVPEGQNRYYRLHRGPYPPVHSR